MELSRKVEHDEARKLLDEIEQTEQTDWDTIKGLFTAMYGHHKAEEGIVFPALKGFDQETNDLVERLITEHNAWNSAMSTMIGEHKFDRPKFLVLKGVVLEHMHVEETTLFKKAHKVLTEEQLEGVLPQFVGIEQNQKQEAEKKIFM